MKYRTLVLNADGRPLVVISWKRAIILLAEEIVQQLDFYPGKKIYDTKGRAYPIPAVVIKTKYVRRNYHNTPFNKKNIYIRDSLTCQYCGQKFPRSQLTLDHVIPRSKWTKAHGETPTCWENIVTACITCNSTKSNKTCEQAKMFPINTPIRPNYTELFLGISPWDRFPKEWEPYLQYSPLFKKIQEVV